MDETLALPTEEAVKLALRTQQIIAAESETVNSVDPLGGSYVVESLTNRLEEGALDLFALGRTGRHGLCHRARVSTAEILDASQRYQRESSGRTEHRRGDDA